MNIPAERAVARAKKLGLGPRRRRKRNSFEENDQVWAVFDRDEHPRFNEAVTLCKQGSVGVARSNPCFELWLILHFEEFDKPVDRHAVQQELERICPEYSRSNRKMPNCTDLVGRVEIAEQRGELSL